jgi:hypothetical protein
VWTGLVATTRDSRRGAEPAETNTPRAAPTPKPPSYCFLFPWRSWRLGENLAVRARSAGGADGSHRDHTGLSQMRRARRDQHAPERPPRRSHNPIFSFSLASLASWREPPQFSACSAPPREPRSPVAPLAPWREPRSSSSNPSPHSASGSGRIWNLTILLFVPCPPSRCQGAAVPKSAHTARPFHPASGSSIRPSSPRE